LLTNIVVLIGPFSIVFIFWGLWLFFAFSVIFSKFFMKSIGNGCAKGLQALVESRMRFVL